jgi:hypothetical protein
MTVTSLWIMRRRSIESAPITKLLVDRRAISRSFFGKFFLFTQSLRLMLLMLTLSESSAHSQYSLTISSEVGPHFLSTRITPRSSSANIPVPYSDALRALTHGHNQCRRNGCGFYKPTINPSNWCGILGALVKNVS